MQCNCHINVEVCVSVKAIKYIHKYIYKGNDRTTLEVQDHDEIKEFLDARYSVTPASETAPASETTGSEWAI